MSYLANPLNVKRIDHVVIRVERLEEMINFYTEVLGCSHERGPGAFGLAQLRAGDSLIDLLDAGSEFGSKSGRKPEHEAPNMDHVCLRISPWEDEAILSHLKKHNVAHGPIEQRYGADGKGPSLYLRDPEGNSIELKG